MAKRGRPAIYTKKQVAEYKRYRERDKNLYVYTEKRVVKGKTVKGKAIRLKLSTIKEYYDAKMKIIVSSGRTRISQKEIVDYLVAPTQQTSVSYAEAVNSAGYTGTFKEWESLSYNAKRAILDDDMDNIYWRQRGLGKTGKEAGKYISRAIWGSL